MASGKGDEELRRLGEVFLEMSFPRLLLASFVGWSALATAVTLTAQAVPQRQSAQAPDGDGTEEDNG